MLSFIANIFQPVASLVDDLHTSDEEKLKLTLKMKAMENEIAIRVLDYEKQLLASRSSIVQAEATGASWLQRNWRPITMITMLVLVVLQALGLTPHELPEWFGTLFQIGLGGYVIGRSAEKIVPKIMDRSGNPGH